jgi:hypothetical protein
MAHVRKTKGKFSDGKNEIFPFSPKAKNKNILLGYGTKNSLMIMRKTVTIL